MSEALVDRRNVLKQAALGALAFELDGVRVLLSPAEARAEGIPFQVLTRQEVLLIEALGRTIVPGADEAGLAHYLDHQFAAKPEEALLMLRYMDVPPPYVDFYLPALRAADAVARTRFGRSLTSLAEEEAHSLVGMLAQGLKEGWQGPPAPFFYFVFRADAIDVTYGTVQGFERLGVPYVPHIEPVKAW